MTNFYYDYILLRKEMEEVNTESKKERLNQKEEINKMKMELININELHKQVYII